MVIKVFEFSETFETLSQFKREVDVYINLSDLQGVLVPRIFGYGASWGHFLGFIALEAQGQTIEEVGIDPILRRALIGGLAVLHERKIYHNDFNLSNIVLPPLDEHSQQSTFPFRFIDFGESLCRCHDTLLDHEKEEFENLLSSESKW